MSAAKVEAAQGNRAAARSSRWVPGLPFDKPSMTSAAEATPAAQARARPVGVAHLGHCAFAPELCEINSTTGVFAKVRRVGDEGPGDESLRPEAKDNAVSGRGLRWPGSVDHAVVIDRLGRGNLDVTERPLVRPWLPGDDRFHLVSRKDRVDVKTAAEAEGSAAGEVRDLRQIDNGWRLGQVVAHMQRRRCCASPGPGSTWVAPASASASRVTVEVVPGALISIPLCQARASASTPCGDSRDLASA